MTGVGKLNRGRNLPAGRRPAWIVSIKVGPTTMRRRPAWIVFEVGTTKGWVCGVAEEDRDWLGSSTGPHTKEVWTMPAARLCNKALISYGYK
jgi:hypothetical protein